ncbi:KTSC domain-containing protein [Dyadobacter sandarakinus]|uniref:KTSC domain-containing protein n=1 Tax=Dyadobacter sandarakinus TaxID=2747268 RepID=A0ABX7I653_9BACT|nr:KTSC domain-containing protein [Dyadobacter sandarakinus]QRR00486.1 KTSC domain-containing protein [Dyadobacter sandarakinus]
MPSSVVAHFSYDEETGTLRIRYVSGMVYDYRKVPLEVYRAMRDAPSKGIFLNTFIKDQYDFEKVE